MELMRKANNETGVFLYKGFTFPVPTERNDDNRKSCKTVGNCLETLAKEMVHSLTTIVHRVQVALFALGNSSNLGTGTFQLSGCSLAMALLRSYTKYGKSDPVVYKLQLCSPLVPEIIAHRRVQ